MSTHYTGCLWTKSSKGLSPCDLGGNREHLCEACLTYLIKLERPEGWSPRVSKPEPKKP